MSQRLHFVGDVMIGRSFNNRFAENPDFNPWGDTPTLLGNRRSPVFSEHLEDDDIVIGNLETTLTTAETPWPDKVFNFKLDPTYADTLLIPNFTYLNLANNHILDYQLPGMLETFQTLDDLGIAYGGAGLNLDQAKQATILQPEGDYRIHIISAADHYDYWQAGIPYSPWKGDRRSPRGSSILKGTEGIYYFDINQPSIFVAEIAQYTRNLPSEDVVILSLHWGSNWEGNPNLPLSSPRQRPIIPEEKKILARRLVEEAGVKIIHGHSPHHTQSHERIGDAVIFYAMGDFVDDYAIDPIFRNDIGGIASVDIDTNGIIQDVIWTPTIIQDMQVNLL